MLSKIEEYAKELSVLYVEDEDDIKAALMKSLTRFFGTVYTASNGKEGYEVFLLKRPDIIITDIRMPIASGLDMLKAIKEKFADVPTVVTTAFNDQEYLLESIKLGVDRYVLKPVQFEQMREALLSVAKMVYDKKRSEELTIKLMQEKVNETRDETLHMVANTYPHPFVVFSNGKPIFMNTAFAMTFTEVQIQKLSSGEIELQSFFENRDGILSRLSQYNPKNPQHNCVSIMTKKGRKIFSLTLQETLMPQSNEQCTLYAFTDITALEYQKIKNKNHSTLLHELLMQLNTRQEKAAKEERALVPSTEEKKPEPTVPAQENFTKLRDFISEESMQIFKQKQNEKRISAEEYVAELDSDIIESIEELIEIEDELYELNENMNDGFNIDMLRRIGQRYERYANTVMPLIEFKDLAAAIKDFGGLLKTIDEAEISPKLYLKLSMYIENIRMDLVSWRLNVFTLKSAQNIHYFDSSLLSSCLQARIECNMIDGVSVDDELELFA